MADLRTVPARIGVTTHGGRRYTNQVVLFRARPLVALRDAPHHRRRCLPVRLVGESRMQPKYRGNGTPERTGSRFFPTVSGHVELRKTSPTRPVP